jgi:serine/threonine-protein kinase
VFLVGDPKSPTVKVLDFGISKVGDNGGAALTRTGMIMGTPGYMAPEQARGEKVDHRVDIYAVGGILYRALTGRRPFESDDPASVIAAVLTEDPPRPRSLDPSIPEALELIIQRAMAKDPENRYQTMEHLEGELATFDPSGSSLSIFEPGGAGQSATSHLLSTKAAAQFDTAARTMLAGGAPAPSTSTPHGLTRTTREAKMARPMIVLLTIIAYGWVLGGLVDALAGVIRMKRGSASNISSTEGLLITIGAGAATLTPLILWIRHLARGWGNSVRAVEIADGMRRVTVVSIAASGIGALVVRLMEVAVRGQALDLAWPSWSPVLFLVSILGGAFGYFSFHIERRGK